MYWVLLWAKLIDFLLFCLVFFGQMAVTLALLWVLLLACDWVEDKIRAYLKKRAPKSKIPFGW